MKTLFVLVFVLSVTPSPLSAKPVQAPFGQPQSVRTRAIDPRYAEEIARASRRFDVDPAWIRAVIARESAFNPGAVSHAGAMGLMQVMPQTYAALARRHELGDDPFWPGDNIMAGAAYLREMHDLFGEAGVFAAYNAGPGRYRDHLDTGRPLPRETREYDRRVRSSLARDGSEPLSLAAIRPGEAKAEVADVARMEVRERLFVDRTRARSALSPPSAVSIPGGGLQ